MKRYIYFILILISFKGLYGFNSLSKAQSFAASIPEYPPIENENVLNPRFSKYHAQRAPTPFMRLLEKIGLRRPAWSPYDLEAIAHNVIKQLESTKYTQTLDLSVKEGTECIIIGPLFGAYHSLVRILDDLKKRSFINDNLQLLNKSSYLIFNGNVIDGSPHTLETLTLVLSLLQKNPRQVIYLQGQHEHNKFWLNHGLKYELKERARYLPQLKNMLTELFALLPKRINLRVDKENNFIQISNLPMEEKTPDLAMQALIKAESRNVSYQLHPGIALLQPAHNATVWSVFSAPTELYKKEYDFMYDAYVILTIAAPISNSTVTLINRNIKTKDPFKKTKVYSIVTAQEITDGDTTALIEVKPENTITLGSTMDLSRTLKGLGINIKAGISAAVNRINQHGGINNKLFRVFIEDDQYTGTLARANIDMFRKEVSPIILTPVGSPTLAAALDLIKENQIYVLFPATGSLLFRDPSLTSIINFRASYAAEAEALTYYSKKKLLGKDFAFFYQDDAYGYAPLNGARRMLKSLGIEKWTEVSYQTNTVRVEEAVETIKKANPDVIGLFSVATATIELIKRLGVEFLSTKKLFAISPLGDDAFKQFLDSMGLKVLG